MSDLFAELRHTTRRLIARPVYSSVIIVTLALGFGANTAIFSLVRGVLMTSLPYAAPDELVLLLNQFPEAGDRDMGVSPAEMSDLAAEEGLFQDVAGVRTGEQNALWTLSVDGRTEKHEGAWVTQNFFDVLGVEAGLGRTFLPEEGVEGRHQVMVLENNFWRQRFAADPSIVGSTLIIRGEPLEVVGVAPEGFNTDWNMSNATPVDFWIVEPDRTEGQRRWWAYRAVARLAPGVTIGQARARVSAIANGFAETYPEAYRSADEYDISVESIAGRITGDVRTALMVLFATVGAVLLIACMNVANLLLVRAEGASRELALRSALGASRAAVIRPFLMETGVLTAVGAVSGVLVAVGAVALVRQFNPGGIPRIEEVSLDPMVLLFSGLVAVGTAFLVSLVPALRAARVNAAETLKESGRTGSGGVAGSRLRRSLVVAEVALALVLTVAAGLLLQSFGNLAGIGIGIRSEGVLSMRMDFPEWQYPEMDGVTQIHEQLLERVAQVPGIGALALGHAEHPLRLNGQWYFAVDGRETDLESTSSMVGIRVVSPQYPQTMGVPLLAGRTFTKQDRADQPYVILINETLAKRRFADEDPIGRRLHIINAGMDSPPLFEIIGVVGDVKNDGIREPSKETLLLPFTNASFALGWTRHMTLHTRTTGDPTALTSAVRAAVAEVSPELTVYDVTTLEQVVSETVAGPRFVSTLVGAFAFLAVLLATLGIYGVISYSVERRTREIGIRIALGARDQQVRKLVVGQGVRLGLMGLVVGSGIAVLATRAMTSLLYGVEPGHLPTYVGGAALLFGLVAASSYIPARRATRIPPVDALRAD